MDGDSTHVQLSSTLFELELLQTPGPQITTKQPDHRTRRPNGPLQDMSYPRHLGQEHLG